MIHEFVELLLDGEWHGIEEVATRLGLSTGKTEVAARFLSKYKFVEFEERAGRMRIDSAAAELWRSLK